MAIRNGCYSRYKIISQIRSRCNFFSIYNLIDWQERTNVDIKAVQDNMLSLEAQKREFDGKFAELEQKNK